MSKLDDSFRSGPEHTSVNALFSRGLFLLRRIIPNQASSGVDSVRSCIRRDLLVPHYLQRSRVLLNRAGPFVLIHRRLDYPLKDFRLSCLGVPPLSAPRSSTFSEEQNGSRRQLARLPKLIPEQVFIEGKT